MRVEYRICVDCGKTFTAKHLRQVRCPDCQKVRTRERQSEYRKERNKSLHKHDPNDCRKKKSCKYSGRAGGVPICDYLEKTGERRGCPVEGCTKYKRKSREVENG